MRKFYLFFVLAFLVQMVSAQDTARFNVSISASGFVNFINQSGLHGDYTRKAIWIFGDGTQQVTPPLAGTVHQYQLQGAITACLKIYKYTNNGSDSVVTGETCRVFTLANTSADSCAANFTDTTATASPLTKIFVAQPWHNHNKKPEQICWQFGDGHDTCISYNPTLANNYHVEHHYAHTGPYNVCVQIHYQGGCTSTYCRVITIPAANTNDSCFVHVYEVAGNINNLVRHFYATINTNHVAQKICWNFGDGTDSCINLSNPLQTQSLAIEHHYPAPGTYHVCARVWYVGGCVAENCHEVIIHSAANICGGYMTDSLTAPKSFLFRGYSVLNSNDHVISWRWTFGDGTQSANQQVSHVYSNPGDYEVCLFIRTDLGCETRICKHLLVQGSATSPLLLSPNPVINNLHAVFQSSLNQQVTISIYNANGVLVHSYTRNAVPGTNAWDFDVSGLPAGIYSVVVSSPNQLANAIFFKQ
jgi:PKD repeat protein